MAAIGSVMLGREERWIQHYCSGHSILLVGEGDFSFSLCLAMAFGSATNIVATSLDSYDQLIQKYKNAKTNLRLLEILGASLLHGVDATRMKMHTDLQYRKFHRIIYNFPHAGFHGKENDLALINMHRSLVHGFFWNARRMLMVDGEIHLSHKVTSPYNKWGIEGLASECALFLVEQPVFSIKDYPGYENKRGAGSRCDEQFRLGECRTFKFKIHLAAEKIPRRRTSDLIHKMPAEFQEVPILGQHQPPPLERLHANTHTQHPYDTHFNLLKRIKYPNFQHPLGYGHVPLRITQTSNIRISYECHEVSDLYIKYVEETFGGISHAPYQSVSGILEKRHNLSVLRSECLRQMVASLYDQRI